MKRPLQVLAAALLVGFSVAGPGGVRAQQVTTVALPPNTVIGNPQPSTAFGSAIPFADLYALLVVTGIPLDSGKIFIGGAGNLAAPQTVSGDCAISLSGVMTCTKTNGVAFATSATTDTTNATNITSGTLATGRLTGSYTGITGVGTLIAGVWNGTTIAVANGGTNCAVASGTCLDNITGFAAAGIVSRAGAGSYNARTITGTASQITVTNGDGVAGNPTLSIPTSPTITTPNIVGTTTNDNAAAGNIGEYKDSSCPDVSAVATITVTIASPAVVTWPSNPFSNAGARADNCPVVFTTSGALPTGITAGTTVWVIASTISGNTFQIASSIDNAIAGTAINTSGSQSGTHTGTGGLAMTTGTAMNMTALRLTAGDWECSGNVSLWSNATTVVSLIASWLSTTSASVPSRPAGGLYMQLAQNLTGATSVLGLPRGRVSLASTTTLYQTAFANFTTSTEVSGGYMGCRRVR